MKIHEGKCTEKILKERERIGSRLAILRKKRNMTQEELANLCGVNRVNIAKIEKGAYNVIPESIGSRATEGCIRLNNDDLERLVTLIYPPLTVVITPSVMDESLNLKK